MDYENLFELLLKSEEESEVEQVLESAGYGLGNENVWWPLGNMENNFPTVGNQQAEPTAALVEKIINGIDAILMVACYQRGLDPESETAPRSMSEAVDKFFNVRDGRLETLDPKEQTSLADSIHGIAVGQKPFAATFTLAAEQETDAKPKPSGQTPPKSGPPGNGKKSLPSLALPEIHEVRKEDWDKRTPPFTPYAALEIKHSGNGGYDFFVNIDNTFLLTEIVRSKDEDRPLVKFWFKFGLALCARGMFHEAKRREEAANRQGEKPDRENGNGDAKDGFAEDLERIGMYCSGVAGAIVPIIRRLYRGPDRPL